MPNLSDIQGWCDFENIYDRMAEQVPPDGIIVELGVWKGRSIIYLAQKLKELGKTSVRVTGVDSFHGRDWDGYARICRLDREIGELRSIKQQLAENICLFDVEQQITLIDSDTIEAAQFFDDGTINFLFVDSTHTVEHVKKELDAWIPKMKRPTWIAGHDYPGNIAPAIDERFPDRIIDRSSWIAKLP
jgi:cephalosporin hydroxylase